MKKLALVVTVMIMMLYRCVFIYFDVCYKLAERFICIFQVTLHLMLKSSMNQWKLTMVVKQAQLAVSSTTIRVL